MSFDVAAYLDARPIQLHRVTEIGHGSRPIVAALPEGVEYTGYDTYDRSHKIIQAGVDREKALRPDAILSDLNRTNYRLRAMQTRLLFPTY